MTTPETQEVASSYTEEEAASALLDKWTKQEPPEEEETAEPEAEQTDEVDAQADEEADTESEESDEVEIDVAGEKFKLPPAIAEQAKRIEAKVKEIEAGTTRKFQEAAEIRKVAEADIQSAQQLKQLAIEQSDLIADHKMVSRRLEALERIDVSSLAESDPVALTKINAEYNQLQAAKQRIEAAYQQAVARESEQKQQNTQQRLQRLNDYAAKNIKGWSDAYSQQLLEFSVKQLGADPSALRAMMSEPVLKALDLAYRGWKVQNTDPKAKQVQATKTLKPGSNQQAQTSKAEADKLAQRLRKSGSLDDAAALLLMKATKRK